MKRRIFYMTVTFLYVALHAASQSQLPSAASPEWFQKTSTQIKELEYGFFPQHAEGNFRVVNNANHLGFTIEPSGYAVFPVGPKNPEKQWGVHFSIRNIGGTKVSNNDFVIIKGKKELVYRHRGYSIQYINDETGLRQNFIIKDKLAGQEQLVIEMDIQTELKTLARNNNQLFFYANDDQKDAKLIYDGLKVFDATGKILTASMDFDGARNLLSIRVDDKNAVYPVTIDPLNRVPEWSTSADGVLPALLTNLQLQVQTLYGYTVAGLGDINGDGFDDVAISAPGMADVITGTGSLTGVGAVFIYLGSPAGLSATPAKILQPTTAVDGALFGYSIDAGDVTGDGKNDIIIGAPLDRYQTSAKALIGTVNVEVTAGKVYVYRSETLFSAPNPTPFLELRLQGSAYFSNVNIPGLFQSNVTTHSLFGFSVAVTKDLNGDNKADIIIGSPSYLGVDILSAQSGAAFIYYSSNLSTTSPAQLNTPTPTLLGLPLLPLANTTGLLFGHSVDGAGDFNNDGYPDVVVGAPAGADLSSLGGIFTGQFLGGSAYIFYGSASGINSTSSVKLQASASGLLSNTANLFGYEVKGAKNALGNRTGNIIIGAPNGAVLSNVLGGLQVNAGQLHVFKKRTSGATTGTFVSDQVITSPRSTSILSILAGQTIKLTVLFASSIDNMLDVNCDNIGDIIVGEPLSSAVPLIGANVVGGAAYVYLGNLDGTYQPTPIWDLYVNVSPILGVNATSLVGYSVAGAGYTKGKSQGVRSLVGGPSNTLDFGAGLLNLGNTLNVLFSFTFDDNGLGKSYSFPYTSCNIVLPASLIEFQGQKINSSVFLNWTSVTEDNLDVYELQKSRDGINYQTISVINAKGQQHNEYSYTDQQPYIGVNYYRLRMVEKDGKSVYSNIVTVNFKNKEGANLDVSPNPARDIINVRLTDLPKGNYSIEIVNASGQKVITRKLSVTRQDQTEVIQRNPQMKAGMYWLTIYNLNSGERIGARAVVITN